MANLQEGIIIGTVDGNPRVICLQSDLIQQQQQQQPKLTPTGKISHAKTRVYIQRYRKEWEQMNEFKGKKKKKQIKKSLNHNQALLK